MKIAVVLIQLISFVVYCFFITRKYDRQPSVSHSYYILPDNRKFLFTILLWIIAIGQLFHIDLSEWFFMSAAGFGFVGAANAFMDDKTTHIVHYIGAVIGIIGSLLGLYSGLHLIVVLMYYIAILYLVYLMDKKLFIWNLEYIFMVTIAIKLLSIYLVEYDQ